MFLQSTAKKLRRASFGVFANPQDNKSHEGKRIALDSGSMKNTRTPPTESSHKRLMSVPNRNSRPQVVPPLDLEEIVSKTAKSRHRPLPEAKGLSSPSSTDLIRSPFRVPVSRRELLKKHKCYGGFEDTLEDGEPVNEHNDSVRNQFIPSLPAVPPILPGDTPSQIDQGVYQVLSLDQFIKTRFTSRTRSNQEHRILKAMRSSGIKNGKSIKLSPFNGGSTSASSVLVKPTLTKSVWPTNESPFTKTSLLPTKNIKSSLDRDAVTETTPQAVVLEYGTTPTVFFSFQAFSLLEANRNQSQTLLLHPMCSSCSRCLVFGCNYTCSCPGDTLIGKLNDNLKKSSSKSYRDRKSCSMRPFVASLIWIKVPAKSRTELNNSMLQCISHLDSTINTIINSITAINSEVGRQQAYIQGVLDGTTHTPMEKSNSKHWRRLSRSSMRDKKDDKTIVQRRIQSVYNVLSSDIGYRNTCKSLRGILTSNLGDKYDCLCKFTTHE